MESRSNYQCGSPNNSKQSLTHLFRIRPSSGFDFLGVSSHHLAKPKPVFMFWGCCFLGGGRYSVRRSKDFLSRHRDIGVSFIIVY
jgi:hypothetical protein